MILQPSSSFAPAPAVFIRVGEAVRETVGEPWIGVVVTPFTGVLVGDPLGVVGAVVGIPDVVGVTDGVSFERTLGVSVGLPVPVIVAVGVAAAAVVPVAVAVGVAAAAVVPVAVAVGVAAAAVVTVGLGEGGVSAGSPGNVSAIISARLLNASLSESKPSIGPNSCPAS
jgi:hypothetical protein